MARYFVVMEYPNGDRVTLTTTRRHNGALNELDIAVESKRVQLMKHARAGERVVTGPDEDGSVVVALVIGQEVHQYRYSIER